MPTPTGSTKPTLSRRNIAFPTTLRVFAPRRVWIIEKYVLIGHGFVVDVFPGVSNVWVIYDRFICIMLPLQFRAPVESVSPCQSMLGITCIGTGLQSRYQSISSGHGYSWGAFNCSALQFVPAFVDKDPCPSSIENLNRSRIFKEAIYIYTVYMKLSSASRTSRNFPHHPSWRMRIPEVRLGLKIQPKVKSLYMSCPGCNLGRSTGDKCSIPSLDIRWPLWRIQGIASKH